MLSGLLPGRLAPGRCRGHDVQDPCPLHRYFEACFGMLLLMSMQNWRPSQIAYSCPSVLQTSTKRDRPWQGECCEATNPHTPTCLQQILMCCFTPCPHLVFNSLLNRHVSASLQRCQHCTAIHLTRDPPQDLHTRGNSCIFRLLL